MKQSIEKLRHEYGEVPLLEKELHSDPLKQFSIWLEEAIQAEIMEPNAMVLATVSTTGRPSSRTVLLKKVDKRGLVFFTDSLSRKGTQLKAFPFASLTFWWREMYRQVCIEGEVKAATRKEVLAYFHKRPRGAQLAACSSEQGTPLASRFQLEETYRRLQKKYVGKNIPCPQRWGGFRVIPDRIEFWQGRKNRLHDRFLYVRTDGEWVLTRLSP
ncbi:MAG: pyridoxamine 5'-phosphate oxidase [Chlamydiales bacterium]